MFILGGVFLVAAAATAGFFGLSAPVFDALAHFIPSLVYGMPGWVGQLGAAGAWRLIVQPFLALPCWLPFTALGTVYILLGIRRRG